MLMDLEPIIQQSFLKNKTIVDYVAKLNGGYPNIAVNQPPQGIFPAIEFHQVYGSDEQFADDELISRQYSFQVSIFTEKNDYDEVQEAVDAVMRSNGFTCYNDYTFDRDITKVTHRIFKYTITLTKEMYLELVKKYEIKKHEIGDDL